MSKELPENQKQLTVSTAKQVQKIADETIIEGKLVELPSGLVFRIARPSLAVMLKNGKIPANLVQVAVRQMQGQGIMNATQVKESIEVVELIVCEAVKEPRIVRENPGEDEVSIESLCDEDKGFIFNYVQRGAMDLKPFRSE